MSSSCPFLSVIVPTCQRDDLLALCLERLAPGNQGGMELVAAPAGVFNSEGMAQPAHGQAAPPDAVGNLAIESPARSLTYEVIVTDDGRVSTAERMIRNRFPWVRWTSGPKRGPAANRNHGAHLGRGNWLVFTDDDCLPDTTLLANYHDCITCEPWTLVWEGCIAPERPKRRADEFAPLNSSGGFLWSCNFVIATELFFRVGAFDERFPFAAMEDVELAWRLRSAGVRICFATEARVVHPWRRRGGLQAAKRCLLSHQVFWRLHPEALEKRPAAEYFVGSLRVFKRAVVEIMRFHGRGWRGALGEVLLWVCLWLSALRRSGTGTRRRELTLG